MDYRLSRKLMWIGIDGGMAILAVSLFVNQERFKIAFMIAAVAVFALGVFQALLFYKCPKCGCSLIKSKGGIPENCPQCGEYLRLEDKYEEQKKEKQE